MSLYLADALGFAENTAAAFYHAFVLLCYTTPLIGALLADSILGKFKTILYLSIVYAIGQIVLTVGSIGYDSKSLTVYVVHYMLIQVFEIAFHSKKRKKKIIYFPYFRALSFIGLVMIAFGTGGIKPCVVSFGAEQFKLPEQENRLSTYFSVFYASINAGSLIATILTPYLRSMECNDSDTCFPVAFGVPAALFIVAIGNYYKSIENDMYIYLYSINQNFLYSMFPWWSNNEHVYNAYAI